MTGTNKGWFVYLLECANGKLYTGITTDLAKRLAAHKSGAGAKFTRGNPPLRILAATHCLDRSEASKLEYRIKQLTAMQKRDLAASWPPILPR
jgi:putative endonuclease